MSLGSYPQPGPALAAGEGAFGEWASKWKISVYLSLLFFLIRYKFKKIHKEGADAAQQVKPPPLTPESYLEAISHCFPGASREPVRSTANPAAPPIPRHPFSIVVF